MNEETKTIKVPLPLSVVERAQVCADKNLRTLPKELSFLIAKHFVAQQEG